MKIFCKCGSEMKFDSILIPGIEEYEDFYICKCGEKIDYYKATEGGEEVQ